MIPQIIHQIWIGPKKRPDVYMKTWYEDYLNMYPHYTYMMWDDIKVNEILQRNLIIKELYDMEKTMYGKADIARYMITYYYGGIYIDADSVWVNNKNLDKLINESGDFFVATEPNKNWFANGVFGCTKLNKKMELLISRLESIRDTYVHLRTVERHDAWQITGPLLINMFNKLNPTYKFVVIQYAHDTDKISTNWYTIFEDSVKRYNELVNSGNNVVVLLNIPNINVLAKRGDNDHVDYCVNYVKDAFMTNETKVFPPHYFYPISWIGIKDPNLHTKMTLDPECFMFQYGISTNNLQY